MRVEVELARAIEWWENLPDETRRALTEQTDKVFASGHRVAELEAELVRERARADELEKELDLAKLRASEWQQNSQDQYEARTMAEGRADELREALRFYAYEANWQECVGEDGWAWESPAEVDLGVRARAALSGDET